jgi:flagellar hook-associated protein FlgK
MSDLVGISSGAVQAYQRALGVVSNNIANVGTEGYTRQVADFAATQPRRSGQTYIGTGVEFQAIRRQFDEFINTNLRNSNSELAAQNPMIDYANRVVDIMGSDSSSVTTALNAFFAGARDLSAEPSSIIRRGAFLTNAENVALRFNQLAKEFESIEAELKAFFQVTADEFNNLSRELGRINGELSRKADEGLQPATLLDQRDLLLQKMSSLAGIQVAYEASGGARVSVGESTTDRVVLDGQEQVDIGLGKVVGNATNFAVLLDPYGAKKPVSSFRGGELGGIMAFTEQLLFPAKASLDYLAEAFANQVNLIHKDGLDGYGMPGEALFRLGTEGSNFAAGIGLNVTDSQKIVTAAMFRVGRDADNVSDVTASWRYQEPEYVNTAPPLISDAFENNLEVPSSVSVKPGQNFSPVATIQRGTKDTTLRFELENTGQQLQVFTKEGVQLLGAELSVSERADIYTQKPSQFVQGSIYNATYLNKARDSAYMAADYFVGVKASPIRRDGYAPSGEFTGVVTDAAEISGKPIASGLTGNVINAGDFLLNGIALGSLTSGPGAELKAVDIASWLNQARRQTMGSGTGAVSVAEGAINLSMNFQIKGAGAYPVGVDLPEGQSSFGSLTALRDSINQHSELTKVAAAITSASGVSYLTLTALAGYADSSISFVENPNGVDGFTAIALNETRFDPSKMDLTKNLSVNGASGIARTAVGGAGVTLKNIVDQINAESATTKVNARIDSDGYFVLSNANGYEGEDISVNYSGNTLQIPAGTLKGQVKLSRSATSMLRPDEVEPDIRLGFGSAAKPYSLQQIGLTPGIYLPDDTPNDLIVIATGEGDFKISAEYQLNQSNGKSYLREHPFYVKFVSLQDYQIVDVKSDTVVASRTVDIHKLPIEIEYSGMSIELSSVPAIGDKFSVDGNRDGVGDNTAILRLVELEDKKVLPSGQTITEAYIAQVSNIGNLSKQASIARDALAVVYEQSVDAKQSSSGVSLDEEAADLIRFQQAYQASAKVLQTASSLFDSILAVR